MTRNPSEYDDPELKEINELARLERARHPQSRRARTGGTALIGFAVAILIVLGIGLAWFAGVF